MHVLGIEGTAWALSAAVVSDTEVISRADHPYRPPSGGIHPREAAQHHSAHVGEVLREALAGAAARGVPARRLDGVAFSQGPGMGPCLRTVATAARALALKLRRPLVGVNHPVAHIEVGRWRTGARDPAVLYLSGANSQVLVAHRGRYRVLGETLDIGLGNALDKFGRFLGLSHPGGPRVEELARKGSRHLPLPYTVKGMDLSFAGLETAAEGLVKSGARPEDAARSLQETAFAMAVEVAERAAAYAGKEEVLLAGGVGANLRLQEMLRAMAGARGARFLVPEREFLADNGVMIGHLGLRLLRHGVETPVEASGVLPYQRADQVSLPWLEEARLESPASLRGAEAVVELHDGEAIKTRVPKAYRIAPIEERLREERLRREARLMVEARRAGVPTPVLRGVDTGAGALRMERLDGPLLRDSLTAGACREAGRLLGRLHAASIVHGDPTPSNFLFSGGRLHVIDFGMAESSREEEARGVDLHLFLQCAPGFRRAFREGYRSGFPGSGGPLRRAAEIGRRVRYYRG